MKNEFKYLIVLFLLACTLVIGCTEQTSNTNKGDILYNESKYQDALVEYDKISLQNPNNANNWIKRGLTLDKLERYPEALVSLSKGIKLSPNLLDCNNQSGLCTFKISENKTYWSGIKKIKINNSSSLDSSIYYCSGDSCLLDLGAIKNRSKNAISYYAEITGSNSDRSIVLLCSYTDIMGKCE